MSLIEALSRSVINGDSEKAVELAKKVVNQGLDINDAIINGLNIGMRKVSELYSKGEYYLPEIIISADALYDALQVLKPHIKSQEMEKKGTVVIGVVRGDIHDIGKNLTKMFLEASGYEVIDCGRNVKPETFIEEIKRHNANILALSTLMNPTLKSISELVHKLEGLNLKDKLKIIIGGAATSEEFAKTIDVIYCNDASKAAKVLDDLSIGGDKWWKR